MKTINFINLKLRAKLKAHCLSVGDVSGASLVEFKYPDNNKQNVLRVLCQLRIKSSKFLFSDFSIELFLKRILVEIKLIFSRSM